MRCPKCGDDTKIERRSSLHSYTLTSTHYNLCGRCGYSWSITPDYKKLVERVATLCEEAKEENVKRMVRRLECQCSDLHAVLTAVSMALRLNDTSLLEEWIDSSPAF